MNNQHKISYEKPFLDIDEQIVKLKSRGMNFYDEDLAKHTLSNINYYRLSGYWVIYEEGSDTHNFKTETTFEKVVDIYKFDRELRILFLEAIERIEVSIRTKFAHELSSLYGSHFHLNPEIFNCPIRYSQTLISLKNEVNRSKEACVVHFKNNYKESLPPIWSSVELMTLGHISNWFDNIKLRKDKLLISKQYDLDAKILASFLHHLTIIRNICAHHSRLWNKKFTLSFVVPKNVNILNHTFNTEMRKNIYNTIVMIDLLFNYIDENNNWMHRVEDLINKYNIDKLKMGFPEEQKDNY